MMSEPTLFDQINIPLTNKVESYYSKEVQNKRLTQKERIYIAIKELYKPSQREISEVTGIPRHLIPDRIKSLLDENRIRIAGSKFDEITKKDVTTYEVNN